MNKNIFLNLTIEKQIEYLNSQLNDGETVLKIREYFGVGEKRLQKIIKNANYKYDAKQKQYVINKVIPHNYIDKNEVIHKDNSVLHEIINIDNIKYFNKNFELFKNMIETFKNNTSNISTSNIIISLQDYTHIKKNPRPVRINSFVDDDWIKFCAENKRFTKKELISMALKEYMERHTK